MAFTHGNYKVVLSPSIPHGYLTPRNAPFYHPLLPQKGPISGQPGYRSRTPWRGTFWPVPGTPAGHSSLPGTRAGQAGSLRTGSRIPVLPAWLPFLLDRPRAGSSVHGANRARCGNEVGQAACRARDVILAGCTVAHWPVGQVHTSPDMRTAGGRGSVQGPARLRALHGEE